MAAATWPTRERSALNEVLAQPSMYRKRWAMEMASGARGCREGITTFRLLAASRAGVWDPPRGGIAQERAETPQERSDEETPRTGAFPRGGDLTRPPRDAEDDRRPK